MAKSMGMNMSKAYRIIPALVVLLMLAGGCRGIDITLDPAEFDPRVDIMEPYKGTAANLLAVRNMASYADCTGYKSPYSMDDYHIKGVLLPEYFYRVFEKGFASAGIRVVDKSSPRDGLPSIRVTLLAVSPAEYKFDLNLYHDGKVVFSKVYSAVEPPLLGGERSRDALRERAYRMADAAVQNVLADPEFKDALLKAQP
ncbi:MAG: hypothetical protein ACLFOY_14435 [Desulfatibacillaceae bacterium]